MNGWMRTLSIYRLAFGQPRQTELVEQLLQQELTDKEFAEIQSALVVTLSPIVYSQAQRTETEPQECISLE